MLQKIIFILFVSSFFVVGCSSNNIIVKAKNYKRLEGLTIRTNKITLGPLEKVSKVVSKQIQKDIDSGKCGGNISIEIDGDDTYSCQTSQK